jgi:O-methyltransferase involved in polyketide biosynthesis
MRSHLATGPGAPVHVRPERRTSTSRAGVRCLAQGTHLRTSGHLAWLRSLAGDEGLLIDPSARQLASSQFDLKSIDAGETSVEDSFDMLATKFIDETLLQVSCAVNMNREQEYSQVVIVGDGFCTRFARLPWPAGTIIYLVAPSEVHERAEAILRDLKVSVPRGCLLKRVDFDFDRSEVDLRSSLQDIGFRGDRLSVWGLQGIRKMRLSQGKIADLLSGICDAAAFESIVLGEFPASTVSEMENFFASYGFVASCMPLQFVAQECLPSGLNAADSKWVRSIAQFDDQNKAFPRIFRANQRRVSLDEMDMYNAHVQAAEEVDEDFFGNFS